MRIILYAAAAIFAVVGFYAATGGYIIPAALCWVIAAMLGAVAMTRTGGKRT